MIPIRTSISPRHTPYANYLLIAANVFIFLLTFWPHEVFIYGQRLVEPLRPAASSSCSPPDDLHLAVVTYAFLHGGWMHIIGNMYFLFMFATTSTTAGNCGVFVLLLCRGGFFQASAIPLLHTSPVLGASGAVAAVTGPTWSCSQIR
jgi:membrane associated rhomboid family serine protease